MSIFRSISRIINNAYTKALIFGGRIMYRRHYSNLYNQLRKKYPEMNSFDSVTERKWREHWHRLSKNPHLDSFRLFSFYIGSDINIVPEDVSSGIIQPILNPIETRPFYQDKNMFDRLLGFGCCAETLLRSINGVYHDIGYKTIIIPTQKDTLVVKSKKLSDKGSNEFEKWIDSIADKCLTIFIKPAVDTSSGQGVIGFKRNELGRYQEIGGHRFLDYEFLMEYQKSYPDFILQKGLTQLSYINQFNPTSINTLRVATYRSVVDNKTHVTAIVMRIGKNGSYVDNSHAGGMTVGVSLSGELGKFVIDQYGNKYDTFNGINFKKNFRIPNFDKVIKFAEHIGDSILHHRLIAQDICIEADGTPRLVEFNIKAFSVWLFQFTNSPALGSYSEEIIEYCKQRINEIRKVVIEPF